MKTKEVKATKIAAKKETKEMTKNLFYIINVLNKCAKKQTSPTGCKLENVAKIVSEANRITGKGITFAVLPQNSSGVVCRLRKVTPKNYNGGIKHSECRRSGANIIVAVRECASNSTATNKILQNIL